MDEPLPLVNHISVGTNQLEAALSFYDTVLATLGAKRILDMPGIGAAYGRKYPEFWVQKPHDQQVASSANGVHFGFWANSIEEVNSFYQAAMEHHAINNGEPAPRPQYSDAYYGCFVIDPEGHKIEAMYWDQSKAPELPA